MKLITNVQCIYRSRRYATIILPKRKHYYRKTVRLSFILSNDIYSNSNYACRSILISRQMNLKKILAVNKFFNIKKKHLYDSKK